LQRLAQTLSPFIPADRLNTILDGYQPAIMRAFGKQMRAKLGLFSEQQNDNQILSELLALMSKEGSDYTR
ncbi:protein adenylyltransferase SelO family protein, partial [Roseburia faecis]|nr:protein adenylyltransferase SelO family protein [Roseburia faecis]